LQKVKKENPSLWKQITLDEPVPLDHPSIAIDYNATASVLQRLRSRSLVAWKVSRKRKEKEK